MPFTRIKKETKARAKDVEALKNSWSQAPDLSKRRVLARTDETAAVFRDVDWERFRQDQEWGANRKQANLLWFAILGEEFGEAAKEVLELRDDLLREELVQVAAVAVAWIEALDAKKEEEGDHC
jgi:hypothetical protein